MVRPPVPDIGPETPEERALEAKRRAVAAECSRQERLLMEDALKLLKLDQLHLKDITETFLLRRLVTGLFSSSVTERQWATQQLLQLKKMKSKSPAERTSPEDAEGIAILEELRPTT